MNLSLNRCQAYMRVCVYVCVCMCYASGIWRRGWRGPNDYYLPTLPFLPFLPSPYTSQWPICVPSLKKKKKLTKSYTYKPPAELRFKTTALQVSATKRGLGGICFPHKASKTSPSGCPEATEPYSAAVLRSLQRPLG